MDIIDSFLNDNATPERYELLMDAQQLLTSTGSFDHEHEIEEYIAAQGDVENSTILMQIESVVLESLRHTTLNYHLVCRDVDSIIPYLTLIKFLTYIETSIESDSILYYINDELDPMEQLLEWVEILQPENLTEISDLLLTVTSTLITNITEIHELRSDIEPVEYDLEFHLRIKALKLLPHPALDKLIGIKLVRINTIKRVMTTEDLNRLYSKLVYAEDTIDSTITPYHIISLAIFSDSKTTSLAYQAKELTNLMYDNVVKVSTITHTIDVILKEAAELCKTMNTI